jgi:hypothetical protein
MYRGVDQDTFTARRVRPRARKAFKKIIFFIATVILVPVIAVTIYVVLTMWADAAEKAGAEREKSISQPVPTVEPVHNEVLTIGSEGYVDYEGNRYVCSPLDKAIYVDYYGPTFTCDKSSIAPTVTSLDS